MMTSRIKKPSYNSNSSRRSRSTTHCTHAIKTNKPHFLLQTQTEDFHEVKIGDNGNVTTSQQPDQISTTASKTDLRKEYNRYCKLYSSEPLDIVAGPLEKASFRLDSSIQLDLKGRGLRGVDCIALGKILSGNTTIHHLNLNDCLLLPQGFQALLEGLSKNTHLQILELRGNNIQSGMIENLCHLLKQNRTLKSLVLEWNCLGASPATFQTFCDALSMNRGLESLDLRNNQISDASGIDIASSLKENTFLRSLDLRWNSLGIQGAKALWDVLQYNKKISEIHLAGNFVPEEIVTHIKTTLAERTEQDAIIQDFSKRTEILTRQIHNTEDGFKNEIQNMVSMFGQDERELKRVLKESQDDVQRLTQTLEDLKGEKNTLLKDIRKLEELIKSSSTRESVLCTALELKSQKINDLEEMVKNQGEEIQKLKGLNLDESVETKIIEGGHGGGNGEIKEENDNLRLALKEALSKINEKDGLISQLNNRLMLYRANINQSKWMD